MKHPQNQTNIIKLRILRGAKKYPPHFNEKVTICPRVQVALDRVYTNMEG